MRRIQFTFRVLIVVFFLLHLSACSLPEGILSIVRGATKQDLPSAEVLFKVVLRQPIQQDAKLMLEVLDDVTGLYFNATRFELTRDEDLHYSVRIPMSVTTEVKYRYIRVGDGTEYEFDSRQQQVRYRILRVNGPEIVLDHIAGWINDPFYGNSGRISGQVIDQANNAPIPNVLAAAGGMQTVTSSDGTFVLTGLMPGVHNLVLYSMDGAYDTFQQGALVAEGANTPVNLFLTKRPVTEVTFSVKVPGDFSSSIPLRLVTNSFTLGNAYADLSSGSAGLAANFPILHKTSQNRYSVTLQLPIGYHLRYKYSQGDGLWNSELSKTGKFVVRERVITANLVINDDIEAFTAEGFAPATIHLQATSTTPAQESVYIQFNPFGWTEPIPMAKAADGKWVFVLQNPLHVLGPVQYRFCLNGICEIAPDTSEEQRIISPASEPQAVLNSVAEWRGSKNVTLDTSSLLLLDAVQPRADFIAGVELTPEYLPGWKASLEPGLAYSSNIGSDWVILPTTWSAGQGDTPTLEGKPGADLQWEDILSYSKYIELSGQKTILYPLINYAQSDELFWNSGDRTEDWWLTWFDAYEKFILNIADIAQMLDLEALIIGDPSMPSYMFNRDTDSVGSSPIPEILSTRQDQFIQKVRAHYSGKLVGVVVLADQTIWEPEWLGQVDAIYVFLNPILESPGGSIEVIRDEFDSILTTQVQPLAEKYGKPIILGVAYPSGDVIGLKNALSTPEQVVTPLEALGYQPDFETQAKVYAAALINAASKDWIDGFISRGYYPYLELQDSSSSIYRKPAADMMWFWYHFLLNKAP